MLYKYDNFYRKIGHIQKMPVAYATGIPFSL